MLAGRCLGMLQVAERRQSGRRSWSESECLVWRRKEDTLFSETENEQKEWEWTEISV